MMPFRIPRSLDESDPYLGTDVVEYDENGIPIQPQYGMAPRAPGMEAQPFDTPPGAELYDPESGPRPDQAVSPLVPSSPQPGKLGFRARLAQAIPGIVHAGLLAAATPNVAGGGPTDIIRAALAPGMYAQAQNRQAALDEQKRRESEANIEQSRAQSESSRAAAAYHDRLARGTPPKPKDDYIIVKDGIFNASTGNWVRKPTEPTEKPPILNPGQTVLGPDHQPIYTAPSRTTPPRALKENKYEDESKGITTTVWSDPATGEEVKRTSEKTPKRARIGEAEKPFTAKDKAAITSQKDTLLNRLAEKTDALLRANPDDAEAVKEDEANEAQAIQAKFESEVSARTGEIIAKPFDMYSFIRKQRAAKEKAKLDAAKVIKDQEDEAKRIAGGEKLKDALIPRTPQARTPTVLSPQGKDPLGIR